MNSRMISYFFPYSLFISFFPHSLFFICIFLSPFILLSFPFLDSLSFIPFPFLFGKLLFLPLLSLSRLPLCPSLLPLFSQQKPHTHTPNSEQNQRGKMSITIPLHLSLFSFVFLFLISLILDS